jgi:hypothetical protein
MVAARRANALILRECNHWRLCNQFDLCCAKDGCSGYVNRMISMFQDLPFVCLDRVAKMSGQSGHGKQCSSCNSDGSRY